MTTRLHVIGDQVVHLDKQTFMWVQVIHFAIDPQMDDDQVVASLLESPAFVHDFASPYPAQPDPSDRSVHGRWVLSAITADRYRPTTAERAEQDLQDWANNQDWVDPNYSQPTDVMERLTQQVYVLLLRGRVYKLRNPEQADEHGYGAVTGNMGFHEFLVIDRAGRQAHLIVAYDD